MGELGGAGVLGLGMVPEAASGGRLAVKQFDATNHFAAVAANAAARQGFTMSELRERCRLAPYVVARRRVVGALLDAGASWLDCERLMGRTRIALKRLVGDIAQSQPKWTGPEYKEQKHPHFCDCDQCLNPLRTGGSAVDSGAIATRDGVTANVRSVASDARWRIGKTGT
jgi:hypothetical protein